MTAVTYRLSGAINPRGRFPAIGVLVFSSRKDNGTYVQYVSMDERVIQFERLDECPWEPIRPVPESTQLELGAPALHGVIWADGEDNCFIGSADIVRAELLMHRWLIDGIANPFERLDFAQLAGHKAWFSEEAKRCEAILSEIDSIRNWLEETLLLSRLRYAIDTAAVSKSVPHMLRRRLGASINRDFLKPNKLSVETVLMRHAKNYFTTDDAVAIVDFTENDLAYSYARDRLASLGVDEANMTPGNVSSAMWFKRLTISDAQRKLKGKQRGSITLVKAGFDIDASKYFRQEFFDSAEWVVGKTRTGRTLETAVIRFAVTFLGRQLGSLNMTVTYEPDRSSRQNNYTSLLHVGPLAQYFKEIDLANKWLILERDSKRNFSLRIAEKAPTG